MSRNLKIIFTLSALLNLVLIGMAVGQGYRHMHERPWEEMKKDLAPETRALMDQTFEGRREKIHAMIGEMREKKKSLRDAISAEVFDLESFKKAVADVEAYSDEMLASKVETFGGLLVQLPKVEREKLAARFVDMITGSHKRGKGGKDGKDGKYAPPPPPPPHGESEGHRPPPPPEQ
jgi:Heavy-metal resistance